MSRPITSHHCDPFYRVRCNGIVCQALRAGIITQQPCFCGKTRSVAHHDDYRKPLAVTWLCHRHHLARHRELGWGFTGQPSSAARLAAKLPSLSFHSVVRSHLLATKRTSVAKLTKPAK